LVANCPITFGTYYPYKVAAADTEIEIEDDTVMEKVVIPW